MVSTSLFQPSAQPPNPQSSTPQAEQRICISGISWQTYQRLKTERSNQNLRFTFYQGELEIMVPSPEHEYYKKVIGRFVETIAEEFIVKLYPLGSTTLDRQDLISGTEPDECFYLTVNKIQAVQGKKRINLEEDPAPDLVVEVDITHRARQRKRVYTALQVPEVWQFDGRSLTIFAFQNQENQNQEYVEAQRSLAFPKIESQAIESFLQQAMKRDYLELVREFRHWLREL